MSYNPKELGIPVRWIGDGVVDCLSGVDEDETAWDKVCGTPPNTRHVSHETDCSVFVEYKCPTQRANKMQTAGGQQTAGEQQISEQRVDMTQLCDRVPDCEGEGEVCRAARDFTHTSNKVDYSRKTSVGLLHCRPGLASLEEMSGSCEQVTWKSPDYPVFGVKEDKFVIPKGVQVDCSMISGLQYVHMSCLGLCKNTECPLSPITPDECTNLHHVIYSISNNDHLTIVETKKGEFYEKHLFACRNRRCIPQDKICNFVDDCGDNSDETNCTNHFQCVETKEYVPQIKVNDGNFDCIDYSDECNETASREIINDEYLRVVCWLMGCLACIGNVTVLCQSARDMREVDSSMGLTNRVLIILISIGDLAIGVYLIVISVIDTINRQREPYYYCKNQVIVILFTTLFLSRTD